MNTRLLIVPMLAALLASCSASSSPEGTNSSTGKGTDTAHTGRLALMAVLDFGNVSLGVASDTSVSITNAGKDSIRILRHTLANPYFTLLDTTAITLKAGASAALRYRFHPADTSSLNAIDSIITDGTPEAYALLLTGKGYHHSVPTGATIVPKPGSMFAFNIYQMDSMGVKVDGSDSPDTNVVIATGLTRFGKQNVSQISQFQPDAGATPDLFLNYESNGDISEWIASEQIDEGWTNAGWLSIPLSATSGSGPTELVLLDTVVNGVSVRYTRGYQSLGSEMLTLPAGTLATVKLQYHFNITRSTGYSASETQVAWYAPSLGMYVRSIHSPGQGRPDDVFELIDYKLIP